MIDVFGCLRHNRETMEEDKKFYTVEEFAEIFRVSPRAIRDAITAGRVRGFKVGISRKFPWRIPVSEFYRVQSAGIIEINENLRKDEK